MIAVDTSVVVPALLAWHAHHERARRRVNGDTWAPAAVLVESYAVLTRLPPPRQLSAATAVELLRDRFTTRVLPARRRDGLTALAALARSGVWGGATYDGLIALNAQAAGATLLSFDERAVATYRKLGVDFELLGQPR